MGRDSVKKINTLIKIKNWNLQLRSRVEATERYETQKVEMDQMQKDPRFAEGSIRAKSIAG